MRNTRFKKGIMLKYKIVITIAFSFLLSMSIIYSFSKSLSNAIINTADALIKRENTLIFKKAYGNKFKVEVDLDDLIKIQKNSKEEIIAVDFNIVDCEKMMIAIIEDMNDGANMISTNGYILDIPLGYMTNSPLLLNLGPKIPLKITTTDVAVGSVNTSIREFGINNALVEIYIIIELETNAILPLKSGTTKDTYKILVASKIIAGKIPSFYGGYITKDSSTFNLPII